MASYLDNANSIKFNPYVQQLPVESMVSVGLQKQNLYDQGIQKIQTSIDTVAGLDVIRDVDKQYLQSRLNELGTNLKSVAAADFSNNQMVTSTAGMAARIAKDQNVINAVISTNRYRKGIEDMTLATKEGKSSPSNDWDFKNQAEIWLNNTDVKATFNGLYNPYTNYKKNALEVIKALTKDETITDNAFSMDSKGNLVISDALVRQKLAGISPEKIQQALVSALSPADFKQMEVDGRYNYSNVDPQTFSVNIANSYKGKVDFYNDQKTRLENAKSSTTSTPEKDKIDQQIQSLDRVIHNINNEYTGITGMINSGNVESAKAKLHIADFMNGFSKAFSFTQTSQEYVGSPFVAARQWREQQSQQWKEFAMKYAQDDRQFDKNYLLKKEQLDISREKNRLKKKELGEIEGGALPYTVNQNELPEVTLARVTNEAQDNLKHIELADATFIQQNGKDDAWLEQQRFAWQNRPQSVDPLVAQHFNNTEAVRRNAQADMTMISQISVEASKKFGNIYDRIPANSPGMMVTNSDGSRTTYSPKDFVDFNSRIDKYKIVVAGGGRVPTPTTVYNDELAKKELSTKEYILYDAYKKQANNLPLTQNERTLIQLGRQYKEMINAPFQKTIHEINDYTGKEIKKRITSSQGMTYNIPLNTPAQKTSFGQRLMAVADIAEKQNGGIANSSDLDPKVLRKIATDTDILGAITVVEGTPYQPIMYEISIQGKDGINKGKFKLTPEQKTTLMGSQYDASPEVQAIRPYQNQIRKMGGYSTGYTQGTTTPENSYLSKIDFPGTGVYGVTGNIVTPDGGRSYSIRLNFKDPITGKIHTDVPYPRTGLMSENQLATAMMGLSDEAIYEMINEQPATANDMNRVKEASKNPF